MFKKLATAGAISAVMGGVIMGAAPAQADNGDDGTNPLSGSYSCHYGSADCQRPDWRWHSGNGNGSGNSNSELVPIELCDTLRGLVPLHNLAILGSTNNHEDVNCANGPVEGGGR